MTCNFTHEYPQFLFAFVFYLMNNFLYRVSRNKINVFKIVIEMFQGPQAYVSPGWYPSKQAHGKVVPTWNYVVVQARGRLRAGRPG